MTTFEFKSRLADVYIQADGFIKKSIPFLSRRKGSFRIDSTNGAAMRAVVMLIWLAASPAFGQTPAAIAADTPRVETGVLNGAAFRIDLPARWSRGLVMYCHGYLPAGATPDLNAPKPLRDLLLARGFAVAQSAYSAQGWAVKEGIEDTEALRQYFVAAYGQPNETLVIGHSMGGLIALATLEKYPEKYDGALPLCGPLNVSLNGLQERVFNMLVIFDYLFPAVVGPLVKPPRDAALDQAAVRAALGAEPLKAAQFAQRFGVAPADIPAVLASRYELNRELQTRSGGNPFDNRNTLYEGLDDDAALNRGVKRYAADSQARDYLRRYYTPTGRIADPLLVLHTTYDPLVPGQEVNEYDDIVTAAGTQDLFVAHFVAAKGHCAFTPAQVDAAFEELLRWLRERTKPAAGELK